MDLIWVKRSMVEISIGDEIAQGGVGEQGLILLSALQEYSQLAFGLIS